jgi:hypothetical protein
MPQVPLSGAARARSRSPRPDQGRSARERRRSLAVKNPSDAVSGVSSCVPVASQPDERSRKAAICVLVLGPQKRTGHVDEAAHPARRAARRHRGSRPAGPQGRAAAPASGATSPPDRAAMCLLPLQGTSHSTASNGAGARYPPSAATVRIVTPARAARAGRSAIRRGSASWAKTSASVRSAMASALPPPPAQ